MVRLATRRWRASFVCVLACFAALAVTGQQLQGQLGDALYSSTEIAPMAWRFVKGVTILFLLMAVVGSLVGREPSTSSIRRPAPGSGFLSYLQPISLPVYIVHQTVLVVLAVWVVQWSVPVPAQWLALVALTLGVSIAFVELLRRTELGRLVVGLGPREKVPVEVPPFADERAGGPLAPAALLAPNQQALASAPAKAR